MQLVTNRNIDPGDRLLALRDGRTELLVPAATQLSPGSAAGRLLTQWAGHLKTGEAELIEMLQHLRLLTGRGYAAERDRAEALMQANGLRWDEYAITLGVSRVRDWVASGIRSMTQEELREEIRKLGLQQADPHAVLLVQAIDRDPHPEDATVALEWVDLFKGDTVYDRREPYDPAIWLQRMAPELRGAAERIRSIGVNRVLVRGAMRLATWFAAGAEFRKVSGFEVTCRQRQQVWKSDATASESPALDVRELQLGKGVELAVAVNITSDASDEILDYLKAASSPVDSLVCLSLQSGQSDQVIANASQAVAVAQTLQQEVRKQVVRRASPKVHLFLVAPAGLALLLAHRWNRMAPTQVYEDLGPGKGYMPAFLIPA